MSEITTKTRILDTAEQLFASQGFAGTSLRAIIKDAEVNTASVHYHFGSKEGLIEAVLLRRAGPVNAKRLESLDELERGHPTGTLPLESVLEAFLAPAVEKHFGKSGRDELLPKLFGRAVADPDEKLRRIIHDIFQKVFERFTDAFMRALPDLSQQDVEWRMHFMIGAMFFAVTVPRIHDAGGHTTRDPIRTIARLVDFISGGMRSPVTELSREPR